MKRKILNAVIATMLVFSLTACSTVSNKDTTSGSVASDISDTSTPSVKELNVAEMFSDRDREIGYDENQCVPIILNDTSASCTNTSVKITNSIVTITTEGSYLISGSLTNGQIIVDAQKTDKLQIILSGANINCDTSAAIYVKQADKVFITLANETENTLANKNEFVSIDENDIDAVIFSKDDLTINGNGTLTVNSAYGHGIVSKDDLVISSGTYSVTSAEHSIAGKDSVRIAAGTFALTSGKDGIHAENVDDATLGFLYIAGGMFTIVATTDGLDAATTLQIDGGNFNITTNGGSGNSSTLSDGNENPDWGRFGEKMDAQSETQVNTASAKGLKATGELIVNAGSFDINSSDDAIHSNANICINDGSFMISSGDDGLHANTRTVINGGTLTISKSYEGIEGNSIDINGGNISVTASDDGLNSAGGNDQSGMGGRPTQAQGQFTADASCYINISGGKTTVNASGDGIDSNGSLTVSGGETYVSGPSNNGNGALDYNGEAQITGGIFVATGASGMAQNFGTTSTQGSILINLQLDSSANRTITLKDSAQNELLSYTPEKEYTSVLVSAPTIKQNADYTIVTGETATEVKMTSLIYGSGGGMGEPGGGGGGRGGGGDMGGFQKPTKP